MSQHYAMPQGSLDGTGYPVPGLHEFVLQLQDLVLDSVDVNDFLNDVAGIFATQVSRPGNHLSCGITTVRHKRPVSVASSDTRARDLDEHQNSLGAGPCLSALRTATLVYVPDLGADLHWPKYSRAAHNASIGSILAIPLRLQASAQAVVNLYSPRTHGFAKESIDAAVDLAYVVAKALDLVLNIAELRDARNDLSAALRSRTVIDMAIGAVMAQSRCTRDAAFQILVRASSHRNMKLRDVAAGIISGIAGEHDVATAYDD